MYIGLRFNENKISQILTNVMSYNRPDIFPVIRGKWGRYRKSVGSKHMKVLPSKTFQGTLYTLNSSWLGIQIGNLTTNVKNHLQVPAKDITWITFHYDGFGMKLLLQEICVNITLH